MKCCIYFKICNVADIIFTIQDLAMKAERLLNLGLWIFVFCSVFTGESSFYTECKKLFPNMVDVLLTRIS